MLLPADVPAKRRLLIKKGDQPWQERSSRLRAGGRNDRGSLTGNKDVQAESNADRQAPEAEEKVGQAKDKVEEIIEKVEHKAREVINRTEDVAHRT